MISKTQQKNNVMVAKNHLPGLNEVPLYEHTHVPWVVVKSDCVEKIVVATGVVEKSPVVDTSVVPGSVFVIGPIVVDWVVLFKVEVEAAVIVVFRTTGFVLRGIAVPVTTWKVV